MNLATGVLVLVTVFWGLSFPLMHDYQNFARDCPGGELVASATMIVLRMAGGLIFLGLVRPALITRPTWSEHRAGCAIGFAFFCGFFLQILGLVWTTPARSAFFTAISSAWVPLLAWAIFRSVPGIWSLIGLGFGLVGVAVMSGAELFVAGSTAWKGDLATVAASLFFAGQILLIDQLGRHGDSAHFTTGLFGSCAVCAAGALAVLLAASGLGWPWWVWLTDLIRRPEVAARLLVLTVVCTVAAFHLMNAYQPRVSANRAALIYLLESVFASAFSIAWGTDIVTAHLIVGGLLILGGNLLVEMAPRRGASAGRISTNDLSLG